MSKQNYSVQNIGAAICMYLKSGLDSDDNQDINIKNFLLTVGSNFPAAKFLQYKDPLCTLGITYLIVASRFDKSFYSEKAGMPVGTAFLFHMLILYVGNKRTHER